MEFEPRQGDSHLIKATHDIGDHHRAGGKSCGDRRPGRCGVRRSGLPEHVSSLICAVRVGDIDDKRWHADLTLERCWSSFGHKATTVDDADSTGELIGLFEVLGGEEDRRAVFGVQAAHLIPNGGARKWVKACRRLVKEEDLRLVDQRECEVKTAAHPTRVGPDTAVGGVGDVNLFEERRRAPSAVCAREPVQGCLKVEEFAPGHPRVNRGVLKGDADLSADGCGVRDDVEPGDTCGAGGRAQKRCKHLDSRAFPCPVRSQKSVDLAFVDRDTHAAHGLNASLERTDEIPRLDCDAHTVSLACAEQAG